MRIGFATVVLGPGLRRLRLRVRRSAQLRLVTLAVGTLYAAGAFAGWDYYDGKGYTLCDKLRTRLNKYSYPEPWKTPNRCGWFVALSLPDFTEPPWEELDPEQHQELIFNLLKSTQFSYGFASAPAHVLPRLRAEAQEFIDSGGRLQLWRTRLVSDFRNRNHPEAWAPPGLQNVVQLRYGPAAAADAALCGDVPRTDRGGRTFIANDELSDLHPGLGYVGGTLASSTVMLHRGRPYFVSGLASIGLTLGWDQGSGPTYFCDLRYTHTPTKRK